MSDSRLNPAERWVLVLLLLAIGLMAGLRWWRLQRLGAASRAPLPEAPSFSPEPRISDPA